MTFSLSKHKAFVHEEVDVDESFEWIKDSYHWEGIHSKQLAYIVLNVVM